MNPLLFIQSDSAVAQSVADTVANSAPQRETLWSLATQGGWTSSSLSLQTLPSQRIREPFSPISSFIFSAALLLPVSRASLSNICFFTGL